MKRKLLLAALALIGLSSAWAQKDVTSQYITNATLSNGTTGWTVSNFNAPVQGNNTTGYASEAYAGWESLEKTSYSMTQKITLPAGNYTLVNYSFFRQGQAYNTNAEKSLAFLKAGDKQVALKTLGSITANKYADSQAEGANVFDSKMYRNTLDFTIAADNTEIEIGLEGTFDEMRSWCIAGMFELINNDILATMDSPFDVTGYLTNPGMEYRNFSGWKEEYTEPRSNGYTFQAQSNNSFGNKAGGYYGEAWQQSGALSDRKMSQELSGLPNGYYKLSAYVSYGSSGAYIFLNNKKTPIEAENSKQYTVGCVIDDGKLSLGLALEGGEKNYLAFDRFTLQFCGDVTAALTTLLEKVSDYEGKIPEASYNKLVSDVATYNKSYSEIDELLNAIDDVNDLYAAADLLVDPYAAYQKLSDEATELAAVPNDNTTANATLASVITTQTTAVENAETVEAIENAIKALKDAMKNYVFAANPEGEDAKFDLNFLLTNPDLTGFTTWKPADGWASDYKDGNSQVMVNDSKTNGDYSYFYEYWSEAPKTDGLFALYLKTTLGAGTYTMSCYAFRDQSIGDTPKSAVYFYANDTQGGEVKTDKLEPAEISFINKEEQEVKIGLKPIEGNTYRWMGIGYVQLYKVPASTVKFPITTEGDIEYTVTVDGDEVDECLPLETVTITVDLAKLEDPDAEIEVIVTDEDGNKIDSPKVSEGVYTFQMVAKDVTVKVSLPTVEIELSVDKNAKWATFISTFDFELNKYTTAFTVVANADGSLNLTEVADGIVPANTPVVVQSSSKLTQKINRSGVRKKATNKYQEGSLQGVVAEAGEQAPEGSFVLQMLEIDGEEKVNFYIVTKDADITVPQYKAYLMPISSNIKAFFLPEDDEEATAIAGFEVLASGNCDAIYTANGVKVNALQKGLNIVKKNGKSYKIYVK